MARYRTHAQRATASAASGLRQASLKHSRENMQQDQLEGTMRNIILGKMRRDGNEAVIGLADFEQANLPMDRVQPIARRMLDGVLREIALNGGEVPDA